jgi:hypothetical protein
VLGLLAVAQAAPPSLEGWATGTVGWLEYRDLWVGDVLFGGFDARSSAFLTDRLLLSATAELTARLGEHHRLRIRPSTRTLRRETVLRPDGTLGGVLTSDGVPLEQALRERLWLDELSWRWRPRADRAVELKAGILPFSIAHGRFLAESWPGAEARLQTGPLGGPPLVADLRLALPTTGGVVQLAGKVGWEPSSFDNLSLEIAVLDDSAGIAPLLEADPGLLLSTFGRANEHFFDAHAPEIFQWIADTYLSDPYGFDLFLADAATHMALDGRGRIGYASLLGRTQLGPLSLDAALTGSWGRGTVGGYRVPDGSPWVTPPSDWATTTPRSRWSHDWRLGAAAADLAATLALGRGWLEGFGQLATGEPDIVAASAEDLSVRAFLAPDQRFLRTRVFPLDAAAAGGGWSLPPGIASSGIVAVGASGGASTDLGGARLQVAVPWAWAGACTGCPEGAEPRRRYGEEVDVLAWLTPGRLRPSAELGAFFPGPYFLDLSDPSRDDLGELPVGWRLFVGIGARLGE